MKHAFRIAALVLALPLCAAAASRAASTPPASSGPLTCAQPTHQAIVTNAARPAYPASAAARQLRGTVLVLIKLDPLGHIVSSSVYKSSGNAAFDQAALQAASRSQYAPKVVDCVAVAGTYLFHVNFEYEQPTSEAMVAARKADAPWNNPFCGASALLTGLNAAHTAYSDEPSDTYALYVVASAHADYAARVTLVGEQGAYTVAIPREAYRVGSGGRHSYLVSLPKSVTIDYYFVDGVGVDGAAIADCPSFVQTVTAAQAMERNVPSVPSGADHLTARFVQALPPLPCGSIYTPVQVTRIFSPTVGRYGNRPLSTEIEAFVDSNGSVAATEVGRSSGVEGIDDAAISAVEHTTFQPATFLCTPVVGTMRIRIDYEP